MLKTRSDTVRFCSTVHSNEIIFEVIVKFVVVVVIRCYRTQVRFCFSVVCDFFLLCHSFSYLGTAERICAKFTGNTCLGPHWEEFECQGQRSRSPVTKTTCALPSPPAATEWNALAANDVTHQQKGPFRRCRG